MLHIYTNIPSILNTQSVNEQNIIHTNGYRHTLAIHIPNIICGHISICIKDYMPNTYLCMDAIHRHWIFHMYTHIHLFNIPNTVTCLSVYGCYIFSSSKNLVEWPKKSLRNILNLWLPGSWLPNYLVFQQDEHLAVIPSVGETLKSPQWSSQTHPRAPGFHMDPEDPKAHRPHVNIYNHLFLTWLNNPGQPWSGPVTYSNPKQNLQNWGNFSSVQ